jgi:hypothetical protein
VRRLAFWTAVAFVVFFVVRNPHGAATTFHGIAGFLSAAASAVGDFLSSLVGGGR